MKVMASVDIECASPAERRLRLTRAGLWLSAFVTVECLCHRETDVASSEHGARSAADGGPLLERMVQVLEMQQKQMDSPAKASRGNIKVPVLVSLPKGDDKALEDLRGWRLEFDRVMRHMNGGSFPPPADQISHLLSSWGLNTKAGLAL